LLWIYIDDHKKMAQWIMAIGLSIHYKPFTINPKF